MGKGVKNNRRQSSVRSVKRKQPNNFKCRFVKPNIVNPEVRAKWDPTKTLQQNLRVLGMQANANDVGGRSHRARECDKSAALAGASSEMEWVQPEESSVPRRGVLFMTEEEQLYLRECIEKHGVAYKKMAMDLKRNWKQHTERHLEKRCQRYMDRLVQAAENEKKAQAGEGKGALEESAAAMEDAEEAEEEEEEEEEVAALVPADMKKGLKVMAERKGKMEAGTVQVRSYPDRSRE